ncbi:MAG: hypothetical protein ACQEP7_03960 [bacterium]
MASLKQSRPLNVYPKAPNRNLFIVHPGEGRKLDLLQSEHDLHYYREQDDFINATDNFQEITLQQENDCEQGVILINNELKKDLDNPDQVKMFLKGDNLFLKPLT